MITYPKTQKKYAENQVRRIKARTSILKTSPLTGRVVPELEIKEIRELFEGNYRIIYRIMDNELVEILTIHHTSRDFISREIL